MNLVPWQQFFLLIFGLYAFLAFIEGWRMCRYKRKAFGLTPQYYIFGAFVWGDALIFGLFWMFVSIVILVSSDWLLFLLVESVFWAIRGIGESIYWFNQQFATINRNPPENLPGYSLVGDDSIWFIYQITAQCVAVISIVCTIYFGTLWMRQLLFAIY